MTNINNDWEYTETEEERFFLEVQMSNAFLEEAMMHWNGEEFPMPGPSFVPPDSFLAAIRDVDHDVIPELIELWIDKRWYTLQSLVKTCNEIKPGSKAIGFVRKVCDSEFLANALGMRYSGDRDLKCWRPFLGHEAFSSYITHKMGLLNENGNVPDQVIVDLVMRKKQKGQNWGQVVFSIIEGAISDEKEENEGDPKLDQRLQGVELAAMVTDQFGELYHGKLVDEKKNYDKPIYWVADECRAKKERGDFKSYIEAYRYCAKHYTICGEPVTVEQLENSYHTAKSKGLL